MELTRIFKESFKDQRWAWEESVRAEKRDRDAEREKDAEMQKDAEREKDLSLCISISLLRPYTFFSRSPLVFKTFLEISDKINAGLVPLQCLCLFFFPNEQNQCARITRNIEKTRPGPKERTSAWRTAPFYAVSLIPPKRFSLSRPCPRDCGLSHHRLWQTKEGRLLAELKADAVPLVYSIFRSQVSARLSSME